MKNIYLFLFVCLPFFAKSQIDTTINLDLLRAPASPASNIIGIAANEVQKPTSVKNFVVSLQKASQNFSSLPANFSVDVAPFQLGKSMKIHDLLTTERIGKQVIKNSFVLSLATKNGTDKTTNKDSTQIGFGLKFTIYQGKIGKETRQTDSTILANMKLSVSYSHKINKHIDSLARTKPEFQEMQKRQIELRKQPLTSEIQTELDTLAHQMNRLKTKIEESESNIENLSSSKAKADSFATVAVKKIQDLKIQRYGFNIDFATGLAWDFRNSTFSNGKMYKYASWITAGWVCEGGFSALGILRHQFNPDKVFADNKKVLKNADIQTLDYGIRFDFSNKENSRFSFNGEYIYRSVLNTTEIKPTCRFTLNANYEVKKNNLLTFSFGRDFDNKIYKDGNVIAALNFISGFGNPQK